MALIGVAHAEPVLPCPFEGLITLDCSTAQGHWFGGDVRCYDPMVDPFVDYKCWNYGGITVMYEGKDGRFHRLYGYPGETLQ